MTVFFYKGLTRKLNFFLFFLIIKLSFSAPAVTAHIFNPTPELAIPTGITTKETKAKVGTHPVIADTKIKQVIPKCNSKPYKLFYASYSLNS